MIIMVMVMVIMMAMAMAMVIMMVMVIGNSDGPSYSIRNFYAVKALFQSICQ